jgi:hypothetical protein
MGDRQVRLTGCEHGEGATAADEMGPNSYARVLFVRRQKTFQQT